MLPHTQLIPIGVPLSLSGGCDSSKSGKEGQRKRAKKRAFVDQDYGSRTATFPGGEIHTCHVSARSPVVSLLEPVCIVQYIAVVRSTVLSTKD